MEDVLGKEAAEQLVRTAALEAVKEFEKWIDGKPIYRKVIT